jgi:hypothetical protein
MFTIYLIGISRYVFFYICLVSYKTKKKFQKKRKNVPIMQLLYCCRVASKGSFLFSLAILIFTFDRGTFKNKPFKNLSVTLI